MKLNGCGTFENIKSLLVLQGVAVRSLCVGNSGTGLDTFWDFLTVVETLTDEK